MTAPKVQRRSVKSPAKPASKATKSPEPSSRKIAAALVSAGKPKTCGGVFTALKVAFGDKVASSLAAEGCRHLPRHNAAKHPHVSAKPRGLMTKAERNAAKQRHAASKVARKSASKTPKGTNRFVTFPDGTKFRVVLTASGEAVLTRVQPSAGAKVERTATKVAAKVASKVAPKGRQKLSKRAAGRLARAVEDGSVKPSAALSRVAASQRGRRNRPVRVA